MLRKAAMIVTIMGGFLGLAYFIAEWLARRDGADADPQGDSDPDDE